MQEHNILSTAQQLHQSGQLHLAEGKYRELLVMHPQNEGALYGMAALALQSGRLNDATGFAERLVLSAPNHSQTHYIMGLILKTQGDLNAASRSLEQAIAFDPDNPALHSLLAALYRDQGDYARASHQYDLTTRLSPYDETAWSYLANSYWQQERFEEATEAFRKVVSLKPELAYAHQNLGYALYEQGFHDSALACYQKASSLSPAHSLLVQQRILIPIISESVDQIDQTRNELNRNLDTMMQEHLRINNPIQEIGRTNFFLAYHGNDDKALQMKFAALYRKICPSLSMTAPHCPQTGGHRRPGKIRVGFISKFFKNHSIGRTSRGIIEQLSRDQFQVVAIFLDPPKDETAQAIASAADEILVIANDLDSARNAIAAKKLDIIFYQDIGMDAFTYFLAFARLAPVQCASFGHPATTGISTIDYYISTDLWEPEDGPNHYSEKLICLKGVSSVAYYYKPAIPEPLKPRSYFALRDDEHIYICPQALFKIHPEFDEILGAILRKDPAGRVVLVDGRYKHWSILLQKRLQQTIPDVADRVQFIHKQRSIDFINLIAVSDVMLDTTHFCGFNTTLEAFAVGVPVITLPGKFMRSRHTAAFYRKMNILDCIAQDQIDFVNKAVKLGCDSVYRDEISCKIRFSSEVLWQETAVIREFERCFENMLVQRVLPDH